MSTTETSLTPVPIALATDQYESARSKCEHIDFFVYAALLVQLVGVMCLIRRFQIESKAFADVMVLAIAGFAVHYFLPLRYRLPFFLLLSLAGIGLVLGVVQSAWLILISLGLIGIVHLPVRLPARIVALVLVGVVLAVLRTGRLGVPWSTAIWPILGSMFMFRLIVYTYDLAHGQAQSSLCQRLSYFFLLPNICFPLFPVVDFRTFVRTYYDAPRHNIYQLGVDWIFRGTIHLLLYRFIHQQLVIDPYDIANLGDLVHYFIWTYLLYLRVSGQFHIIVGLLHLFGFNLPETHRLYYLASSFTDFWRRINIYWKDFMMKIFYYPIFFRAKHLGSTTGLVLSTVVVFFLTWALHAYQWFWIRGSYLFTWNDVIFWTVLCGLVVGNSLWEAKHGRRRTLQSQTRTWTNLVSLLAKTTSTFAVICILWSFWSSESVGFWFSLWPAALTLPTRTQLYAVLWLAVGGIAAGALLFVWRLGIGQLLQANLRARAATVIGSLFVLNLLSISGVYNRLGSAGTVVAALRFGGLNRTELDRLERGYYEDLLTVDRFNTELGALYAKRPLEWERSLSEIGLARSAPGLPYELVPNASSRFRGAALVTNHWGMHDREYVLQSPPGTFRIALLGASHVMGSGVEREKTFEAILEQRLNRDRRGTGHDNYEILNFAVYGYNPIDQIHVLENKVPPFGPDAVFYVGHPEDSKRVVQHVTRSVLKTQQGKEPRHAFLLDIEHRAGIDARTPVRLRRRHLNPFGDEILSWVYNRLVATCKKHGIYPVWVLMPMVPESANPTNVARDVRRAQEAGFLVLDLTGVYHGQDRQSLWLAEWDAHPNALGHQLVADRLYELIQQKRDTIFGTVGQSASSLELFTQ